MRSPIWVESVSVLNRNEGSSYTFLVFGTDPSRWGHPYGSSLSQASIGTMTLTPSLVFWCRAFAMRSPLSGRVAYFYTLDRNKDLFHPPILDCFAMGSPYGSSVVFLPTRSKRSFRWIAGRYSFKMGSPCAGQVLAGLGSWALFFRVVLGMSLVIRWSSGMLWGRGVSWHSGVFAFCVDSVCTPFANTGVGLWPASTGPVASCPPLVDRSALAASWFLSCTGLTRVVAR